ncbi:MAG TPA: hypothetical protein VJT73_04500 [Polyangiaceae bacterium]|nr:hypothetical protein [Polyangiaceae bacterium]
MPVPRSRYLRPPFTFALALLPAWSGAAGAAPSGEPQPTADRAPAQRTGYWSEGDARWFVSTKSDLGTGYVKPYLSFGYGLPHWIWAGIDVNSITTIEFTQIYTGVRAATPVLDLALGVRDTLSFGKPFVTPSGGYSQSDVLDAPGPKARYWAWEAELTAIAPLPHSALVVDLIAVRALDVPPDKFFYDESYRAVVGKPFFAVLRAAGVVRALREDALKVGVLGEYLVSTGRDSGVVRVGPAGEFQLTDHVKVVGGITFAVYTPDQLGFLLGTYAVAGLRYSWATGERDPKLPWQGPFIP